MANCVLEKGPPPVGCNIVAKAPGKVTLQVQPSSVQILAANYNGTDLTVTDSQISFTIVSGRTSLIIVYGFSDPVSGTGTLSEVCTPPGPALDDLRAQDRDRRKEYTICCP
jgi:hypothetical protein